MHVGWRVGVGAAIRCELEQKETRTGAVVQSKCLKDCNNIAGRDPVSFRAGSFQSHMEDTVERRLQLVEHGKYCVCSF